MRILIVFLCFASCLFAAPAKDISTLNNLEMPLIPNVGQSSPEILYTAKTLAGDVSITANKLIYALPKIVEEDPSQNSIKIINENFIGANPFNIFAGEAGETKVNYFRGSGSYTDISTYKSVRFHDLWNDIDLVLAAGYQNIEKVFEVKPQAVPSLIKMSFDGITGLAVTEDGKLKVSTDIGDFEFSKPYAYQNIGGEVVEIPCTYSVDGSSYGFNVGNYDNTTELWIDPIIAGTYIGETGAADILYGVAKDTANSVYAVGAANANITYTNPLPAPPDTFSGLSDAIVFKLNNSLTALTKFTFLGGTGADQANDIVLDGSNNVYVLSTCNTAFPTTVGAYDTSYNASSDACVTKLNSNLDTILASTYLGGTLADVAGSIAYNSTSNQVVVLGHTSSVDFPTTAGVFDTALSTGPDLFLGVFNNTLTTLVASTYYGGTGADTTTEGKALGLDSSGNIFMIASTLSTGMNSGTVYDSVLSGTTDAILAKFNSTLTTLTATYVGGSLVDTGRVLLIDSSDNVYVSGTTASTDYPVTFGALDTSFHGGTDIFLSRFSNNLLTLQTSSYLGSSGNEIPYSLAFDDAGNIAVAGETSATISVSPQACYPVKPGAVDGIVIKLNRDQNGGYKATYVGGTGADRVRDLVLISGNFFLVGETASAGLFPGYFDPTMSTANDGYIAKIDADLCIAPQVDSVTSVSSDGTYGIGSIIPITVTFTSAVAVTGTPQLTLETGASDQVINYSSGTGSNKLIFNYTVTSGNISADLDYVSTTALALNSGTIKSLSGGGGTDANLTLIAPGSINSLGANKNIVIDGAAPATPLISVPVNLSTTIDTTPNISGSAEPNSNIEVRESGTLLCSTTADAFGSWTCTSSALSDATHLLSVTSIDAALNSSTAANVSFTVDSVIPATPTIVFPVNLSATNDNTPAVSGSAEVNSIVEIKEGATSLCVTTANILGNYSCITFPLIEGAHTLTVTSTDIAGNISTGAVVDFTVDSIIPAVPVITSPLNLEVTADSTPTVSGTAEANSSIEIAEGFTVLCSTTANGAGIFSCSTFGLIDGAHSLTATSTDIANNSAVSTSVNITIDTAAPGAPVITLPVSSSVINDTTPTVSGTSEANAAIVVNEGMTTMCSTTADGSGNWSCNSSVLADGVHTFSVTAQDPVGNIGIAGDVTFTIDTLAPAAPTIVSPANLSFIATGTPTVSGTAEINSSVQVKEGVSVLCSTTTDGSGNYSCVSSVLSSGVHSIFVTSTDLAGNSTSSANTSFSIDTTAPVSPVITSPAMSSVINDITPAISGNAEANTTIDVREGVAVLCTTVSNGVGVWSCVSSSLSQGIHNISATSTDTALNVSSPAVSSFTVDSSAPLAPSVNNPSSLSYTSDNTPQISGNAEANSVIEVKEGASVICSTIANGFGVWSCTSSGLSDGAHSISVTSSDGVNVSAATAVSFTVDTTVPQSPAVSQPANGTTTQNQSIALSGTAEANSTVNIYDNNLLIGTTTADGSGNWSYLAENLLIGTHQFGIESKDSTGNISARINITAYVVSSAGISGCTKVDLESAKLGIDGLARTLSALVVKSGTYNLAASKRKVCSKTSSKIVNSNKIKSQQIYNEIWSLAWITIPKDSIYLCSTPLPSGCSTGGIYQTKNRMQALASRLENLSTVNLGNCVKKDIKSKNLTRLIRAVEIKFADQLDLISDNLSQCN